MALFGGKRHWARRVGERRRGKGAVRGARGLRLLDKYWIISGQAGDGPDETQRIRQGTLARPAVQAACQGEVLTGDKPEPGGTFLRGTIESDLDTGIFSSLPSSSVERCTNSLGLIKHHQVRHCDVTELLGDQRQVPPTTIQWLELWSTSTRIHS